VALLKICQQPPEGNCHVSWLDQRRKISLRIAHHEIPHPGIRSSALRIALGFAAAAITVMLADRFGPIAAFWLIAGGFTVVGVAATRVVTVKERKEEVAEAEDQGTGIAAEVVSQAAMQGPERIRFIKQSIRGPGVQFMVSVASAKGNTLTSTGC
jgi:hypothetical protein